MAPLLDGTRVLEAGGRAASVAGLLLAQLGADVLAFPMRRSPEGRPSPEDFVLGANKRHASSDDLSHFESLCAGADLLLLDLPPAELDRLGIEPSGLMSRHQRLVVAAITPFGLEGPARSLVGSDLIAFHGSGIARLLGGHAEDPEAEPPVRAFGEQAAFIAGLTAACAAMHALYQQQRDGVGRLIDISTREAMALMAARELAMPAFGGQPAPRLGRVRGGSAVIPVLPSADGYVAISPREDHQWRRWLGLIGDPGWGREPRFATRALRTTNYPDLFQLMAAWSRNHTGREIFERCQAAHVPCFPFGAPGDMLSEAQLAHRCFFTMLPSPSGKDVLVTRPPFGLPSSDYAVGRPAATGNDWLSRPSGQPAAQRDGRPSRLPLAGTRVLDFSWVIAGPTCTRYLALMGAEVIKIEAPDRPDTGRASELHEVLGQSKLSLQVDLKAPGALDAVRRLISKTDVVVENFATGVMERLGIGYEDLRRIRPDIILLSASGLGRTGPGADWVAYGNLLSAYSGFAALNGFPGQEPRTGLAWADPLCGLFMAFAVVAALHNRDRGGGGRHIDFSMLEGLLWTMPRALLSPQLSGAEATAAGNDDSDFSPHGVYRARGDDRWLAVSVTSDACWRALCSVVPALSRLGGVKEEERRVRRLEIDAALAAWSRDRDPIEAAEELQAAGVPASASATTTDLFEDANLWARGFYRPVLYPDGAPRFLPSLPWLWEDGSYIEARRAPGLGEHNALVLKDIAGLTDVEYKRLEDAGAFASRVAPARGNG
jgi:crotonobetainyl-CoA:carnitine CoA-transferase CaiB-like acyl-CoA transferase